MPQTNVTLMALYRADFQMLLESWPEAKIAIHSNALKRLAEMQGAVQGGACSGSVLPAGALALSASLDNNSLGDPSPLPVRKPSQRAGSGSSQADDEAMVPSNSTFCSSSSTPPPSGSPDANLSPACRVPRRSKRPSVDHGAIVPGRRRSRPSVSLDDGESMQRRKCSQAPSCANRRSVRPGATTQSVPTVMDQLLDGTTVGATGGTDAGSRVGKHESSSITQLDKAELMGKVDDLNGRMDQVVRLLNQLVASSGTSAGVRAVPAALPAAGAAPVTPAARAAATSQATEDPPWWQQVGQSVSKTLSA